MSLQEQFYVEREQYLLNVVSVQNKMIRAWLIGVMATVKLINWRVYVKKNVSIISISELAPLIK